MKPPLDSCAVLTPWTVRNNTVIVVEVNNCRAVLLCWLKVLDSELKAYNGIVKKLGTEAEKLKNSDPEDAKEIAAKQVCLLGFTIQLILLCTYTPVYINVYLVYFCLACFQLLPGSVCTQSEVRWNILL